ncbi:MAG: hypothetical protein COS89_06590 [Deltaproteobacteria bacterium CG07_land_8_20_14_0_80_38_7]|nr:MAG: hypothetical protein COS89_06590 [Deltaproteobacteria bacterium CG07_land_8_20_14_0_80_38_7]
MKNILLSVTVFVLFLTLIACGGSSGSSDLSAGDLSVQGSGSPSLAPSDFSRGVTGEVNLPQQDR